MNPQDDLERYETTDVQDLLRLFGMVQPPPEGRVPATFRAQVLAQIAQRRQPWWRRFWLTPAWVPVLVGSLVLSVALNVWWGTQAGDVLPPGVHRAPDVKSLPQFPGAPGVHQPVQGAPGGQRGLMIGLAGGLVLSVALNVWLGYRLWKAP